MGSATNSRIGYDKFWGLILLVTCVTPIRVPTDGSPVFLWNALAAGGDDAGPFQAWLMLGTFTAIAALLAGLIFREDGRWRHGVLLIAAGATVVLPALHPGVGAGLGSKGYGFAAPLMLAGLGRLSLAALLITYLGAGMRVARPKLLSAQLAGGLGALLLVFSLVVPLDSESSPVAMQLFEKAANFSEHRAELSGYILIGLAALLGSINIIANPFAVTLSQATRLLIVAGYLMLANASYPSNFPEGETFASYLLPQYWAAIRVVACALLAFDALVAMLAITMTRSD